MINYCDDVINLSDDFITDELKQLAEDDLKIIKDKNIKSDKERNLYFYLENFIDDLLEEHGIKDNEDKFIGPMFDLLREKEKVDLTDMRLALFILLQKKEAYPNINFGLPSKPRRDVPKWIKTLKTIKHLQKHQYSYEQAKDLLMEDWDPMEKKDFDIWANYYFEKAHEKYANFGYMADLNEMFSNDVSFEPSGLIEEEPVEEVKIKPKKLKSPEEIKKSLIGRLDSASKLLREFAHVWPEHIWDRLSQTLSDLKREIIPLKSAKTINDRIIRTANIWNKEGFADGADLLIKFAEPDLADKVSDALKGKAPKKEKIIEEEMPMGEEEDIAMEEEMSMKDLPTPDFLQDEEDEGTLEGIDEDLPEMPEPPSDFAEEQTEEVVEEVVDAEEINPFANKNVKVQDVLEILEPLLFKLNDREFPRSLSKADMMLDAMNIASHFPELSEALSKALEMNIYISSRIEKIINKLKGNIQNPVNESSEEIDLSELDNLKK